MSILKILFAIIIFCGVIVASFVIGWKILGTEVVYDPDNFFAGLGILMLLLMVAAFIIGFTNYMRHRGDSDINVKEIPERIPLNKKIVGDKPDDSEL